MSHQIWSPRTNKSNEGEERERERERQRFIPGNVYDVMDVINSCVHFTLRDGNDSRKNVTKRDTNLYFG